MSLVVRMMTDIRVTVINDKLVFDFAMVVETLKSGPTDATEDKSTHK
jgi:hypothetical protein